LQGRPWTQLNFAVSCLVPGILAFTLLGSLLLADVNPPGSSGTLALVGGRVLTQTDAGTVEGTVLIRDGNIVAVGKDVPSRQEPPGSTSPAP
jgi:hypothetical protein